MLSSFWHSHELLRELFARTRERIAIRPGRAVKFKRIRLSASMGCQRFDDSTRQPFDGPINWAYLSNGLRTLAYVICTNIVMIYKHIDKRAIGILKIFLINCVNCTLIRWYARSLSLSNSICFCYIVVTVGPVRPARRRFRHAVCRWSNRRGNWVVLLSESWVVALRLRDRQIKWRVLSLSLSLVLLATAMSYQCGGRGSDTRRSTPAIVATVLFFLSVIFGLSVYS